MADDIEMDPTAERQPDAPGDLEALERLIAQDEAADAARSGQGEEAGGEGRTRNALGQFIEKNADGTTRAGAKTGQRAGQRLTPDEISARDASGRAESAPDSGGQAGQQQQQNDQRKGTAAGKPGGGTEQQEKQGQESTQDGGADPDEGKSAYQREVARRDRSWQALNREKEEFKQRQQELELREQTIQAREQAVRQGQGQAEQPEKYENAAKGFESRALQREARAEELEAAGKYLEADEARQAAAGDRDNARRAVAYAKELRARDPVADSWTRLKADLPEALNVGSVLNQELRTLIRTRPELLGDEAGPYRAAVLAGRKLVAGLEAENGKLKEQAGQVPALQQQLQTLQARVKELESMTSLPGDGGRALNRGQNGGRKAFHELSTAEQEQALERELATTLG